MGRIRTAFATAAVGAVLAAQSATAQSPAPQPSPSAGAAPATPTTQPVAPVTVAPIQQAPIVAPPAPATQPPAPQQPATDNGESPATDDGGSSAGPVQPSQPDTPAPEPSAPAATPDIDLGGDSFFMPTTPAIVCEGVAVPNRLVPIYQAASDRYELGPQGPSILAAINQIETNFGELNLVTSYAGAVGWMQFMPATWDAYGVDADSNGVADPYDPDDAIFSAANYLSASGMPEDTYGAIFAYNHADWYVAEVLANAGCFGNFGSGPLSLTPQLPVLSCKPAPEWSKALPDSYLAAFEAAAGRYELGRRGVWAMAAIARLESEFGKSMSKKLLREVGPLGLDATEWSNFGVDGNDDDKIRRASIEDSAATLARLIWSRGDLRAGVFTHNQASWYVEEVIQDATRMEGRCSVTSTNWPLALPNATPETINWSNLTLTNSTQLSDLRNGLVDPRIVSLIAAITQQHELTISSLRTDHSMMTASGNVSNHYEGRAMDIAAVDGVSCTDVATSSPCAVLGRTMTLLPPEIRPTELIYCFDLDGAGPAFALADHCDHIHAGFSD